MNKGKSFLNISTYSEGKKSTEEKLDTTLRVNGINSIKGWAFFLVGDAKTGYERHYKRSVEQLEFAPSQTVFIERDEVTYRSLRRYKIRHGYKNPVIFGDIREVIKQFAEAGHKIVYVEADGTSAYGQLDLDLYELCQRYQIPYLSINGTLRAQSNKLKQEAARLKLRRTLDKRFPRQGLRYDTKRIIKAIAAQKLPKSCEFMVDSYCGRAHAHMYLSMIINKMWTK
jgi:hypothetical protein